MFDLRAKFEAREDRIAKLRWLQVTELAVKYSNDQEFGAEVRKLIKK